MSVHSPTARRPAKRVSALVLALCHAGLVTTPAWAQMPQPPQNRSATPFELSQTHSPLTAAGQQSASSASAQFLSGQLKQWLGAMSDIEYSDLYGATVSLGLQRNLGDNVSGLIQGRLGEKQQGLLAGLAYRFSSTLRVNFLGERLEQQRHFKAGNEDYRVAQEKLGLGIQHLPDNGLAKLIGLRYNYTHSPDKNLADTTVITDTATLYEKFLIQNRFVGSTTNELRAEAKFDVGQQGELTLNGGPGHTVSNDGADTTGQFVGGAAYAYYAEHGKTTVGARTVADRTETSLDYQGSLGLGNAQWLLGLTSVSGKYSHNDTLVRLGINIPLGTDTSRPLARPGRNSFAELDKGLLEAARGFRSTSVTGREKEISRTRVIAVDKTGLPAGASVASNGTIAAALAVAVSGIASVTLNGAPFTNSGQFSVSGTGLTVNPNLMTQPAVGATHTYVVTMNNVGGGTTVATVTVSHGSVKIDSIVISAGGADTTPPTTSAAPSISVAATDTTVSVTQTINEAGTGYYLVLPAASAEPTVAAVKAGTSFAMTANTPVVVAITGLTASTAYKYYFVAKDAANNDQAAVSTGLAITTTAAADTTPPTTSAAPSISVAATDTTVSVTQTINEAGTGYYLVLPAASAEPTVAAVKAGTSFAMTANTPAVVAITGLTASTAYKYYFVAKDAANNDQVAVSSGLAITTTATPDVVAPNQPTITAGYATSTAANSVTVEVNGEVGASVWVNGTNTSVTIAGTGKSNVNLDTSGADGAKNFAITLEDAASNQSSAANVSITADRTAPTTVSMPSSGVIHNAATVTFTVNEAGTGYYVIQSSGSAPSASSLVSSGTPVALTANVAQAVNFSSLSASTGYTVYFVAKDSLGNTQSSVGSVSFTTTAAPDVTAPTTSAAPSISVAATDTTVSVTQTINEAGTGYYLMLPAASAEPTVAAVKAGTSFAMTANTPAVVAITGLTASTAYKYYFVAKDAANNDQAAVSTGLAITTTLPTGYISQGGLTWMPNNATGTMNWSAANTYCTSTTINGQTGWRLPTSGELISLYNSGALAGQGWTLDFTWSNTTDGAGTYYYVGLQDGGVGTIDGTGDFYVTCVR